MKSVKNNTGTSIITTFITRIIVLGGSFLISVILSRLLGPEGKGIVTAVFIIPNILVSLADLGVRQSAAYYIGRKIYSAEEVLSSSLILWIITSVISVFFAYGYYSFSYTEEYPVLLISIVLIYIPIKILQHYLKGVFQGKGQFNNININEFLSFFVRLITVLIFVLFLGWDVYGAAISYLLAELSIVIYSIFVMKKEYAFQLKYYKGIPQAIFSKGISFALALFIMQLNYKIDIVILEKMVSAAEVGVYSVGVTLAELIWQIPAAISLVLFSKSASSKTDKEAAERTARLLRMSLTVLLIMILIFGVFSNQFVVLLYGEGYKAAADVIVLLLPGVFFMTISKILHPSLSARGYPLYGVWISILPLIINIVLNVILISLYGINGAAISSTFSYLISGVTYAIVYAKKEGLKFYDLLVLKKEDVQMILAVIKK